MGLQQTKCGVSRLTVIHSVSGQAHQAVEQKGKDLAGTLAEPASVLCWNLRRNRTISKTFAEYLMQFFSGGRRLSDDAQ